MSYHISVAPMMNWTDRHARYFMRLLAPDIRLYTEMITTKALLHGNQKKLLAFDPKEKPLALQLGGSESKELATCASLAEQLHYDEVNLNIGCPSSRVYAGRFGACLMREPLLVAECISRMQANVTIPITVKCRIGVDNQANLANLIHFIETVSSAGCNHFIIHARTALLSGLNPKQNRLIPPLRYDLVYEAKKHFPNLTVILNGGIKTIEDINIVRPKVDGVMIGRAAYCNPFFLSEIQKTFFLNLSFLNRINAMIAYLPYVEEQLRQGVRLTNITRHILGLFHGQPNGAVWRRYLSQEAHKTNASIDVIHHALSLLYQKVS